MADLLQDCLDEINSNAAENETANSCDSISHGFKRGRSIRTNAKRHQNRRYVFNVDLEDFFGSINFGRVRGFFIKDRNFHLDSKVATIFAQIACFNQKLPQGSPCSPVISNLIGHILDIHLTRLASRSGCIYSRYADDLTFSTNKREFPQRIAIQNDENNHLWIPGPDLLRLVSLSGFALNNKKTRMQYRSSRQQVTGLVVNKKVNIRREYRHNVRAMAHHLFTKGSFFVPAVARDANGESHPTMIPGSLNQLHGRLGFIDGIDRYNKELFPRKSESSISSKEAIYSRFLFFKEFYVASRPVLICEEWTDYIYIETAIRQLASSYPSLVTSDENGKASFAIRRLKYAGSSTGRILGINGGTGAFSTFISEYKKAFSRFSVPGMTQPMILLIDNDDGAKKILKTVKDLTKPNNVDSKQPFIHVHRNLYLILTPLQNGASKSKIEDLFDASTKSIKLNGKSFNPLNDIDTSTNYGKAIFARKIVEERASSINFGGFVPLLDRIVQVIETYYAKRLA